VLSSAAAIAVAALGILPLAPSDGAALVYAEPAKQHVFARTPPYRIVARSTPAPLESVVRPPRAAKQRPRPLPAALPASAPPAPQPAPATWIRAPEPEPPRARATPKPAVGLDEVLSATSIDDLLRFAPRTPTRPVALVPALRNRSGR
jgi:hypothetical protein